jgi:hypothetical protein
VVLDKQDMSQNLPRRLRFKSLTTQVLADPEIRKRLHERYRYLFFLFFSIFSLTHYPGFGGPGHSKAVTRAVPKEARASASPV